eukprot:1185012-Amorphochlora_amoeboformis.AAC.2
MTEINFKTQTLSRSTRDPFILYQAANTITNKIGLRQLDRKKTETCTAGYPASSDIALNALESSCSPAAAGPSHSASPLGSPPHPP